jgi:iron(III) transport system substrate-binding protein
LLLVPSFVARAAAEEAKPTGKLVLYSPLTTSMIENMLSMFEKNTGIKTECLAMGTGDALKRIAAESENPQCDILWSGTIGTVANSGKYFQDYISANEDAFYPEYRNVEGNMTRFDCVPSVIMINTDLIGDIEIKGYADLLNPALKGKIVFANPQASSSSFEHLVNMLYAMGTDGQPNGWDYVKKFCKQLPNGCVNSSSAVYKGVADGEYAVGLTFEQGAATYVSQGNVKVVYMEEGVIIRGDGVYIVKDCQNLASARIFVDWLTSYAPQDYMNSTQFRRTIRTDIPETGAMQSMSSIKVIVDDEKVASAKKAEWVSQFQDALVDAAE